MQRARAVAIAVAAALGLALGIADSTSAQTCGSPIPASLGDTAFTTTAGNTIVLTGLCDLSQISTDVMYNATWFRFVAPSSGTFVARTCGSVNFDSKMAVFADCSNLASVIGCNDDSAGCTTTNGQAWASKVTFTATAGAAYYVAVGGFGASTVGTGSLNVSSSGTGGPDGSSCTNAITAVAGLNSFNTAGSAETVNLAGLCDPGTAGDEILHRVRWFTYTASASNDVEISTCGLAPFDTRLAVFANCSSTSVIACNDDAAGCSGYTSKVRFAATAGSTYKIAVGGFDVASAGAGQFMLTTNAPPPPACGTSINSCCEPNTTPFCSDQSCCALVCAEDPYCCAVDGAWDATCANRASILCTSCGAGTCQLPASNATETEACGANLNGGCESTPFAAQTITSGVRLAGTFWADADSRDTDWYELKVDGLQTISLNLHSRGPGRVFLVEDGCPGAVIASSDAGAASCPATVAQCVLPGTYHIVVAMTVFSGFPCSDAANRSYVLSVDSAPCDATAPSNDECDTALAVPASGGNYAFDTRLANNSNGALDPTCDEGNGITFVKDVWYAWKPAAGVARITTCGTSNLDTRLAVYVECGGNTVACNDDFAACSNFTSRIDLLSDGSTSYRVRLGGYDSAGIGSISFAVIPPLANDDCGGALPIVPGTTEFSTEDATTSAPPLSSLCEEGFGLAFVKDVWYRYTATANGQVVISTCSSADFDTRLAAYSSCDGTLLACNDDTVGCTALTSRMTFTAAAGSSYLIRVGGHTGGGAGTLSLVANGSGGGAPTNDTCATPIVVPPEGGSITFNSSLAVSDAPTSTSSTCSGNGFFNDIWFSWTPATRGDATLSTCAGAQFDTRMELWTGCPGGGGSVIACNDDYCGNLSAMTVSVDCGTPYLVRIGSYSPAAFGSGVLTVVPGSVQCTTPCPADFNHDQVVTGADLAMMLANWGNPGTGDMNSDGVVNGTDLGLFLSGWGPCPG
jgi:hypothetical protein